MYFSFFLNYDLKEHEKFASRLLLNYSLTIISNLY